MGGVDAIHVDTGCYERYNLQVSTVYEKPGFQLYADKAVKDAVHIPVIGHGKLNDPAVAEKAIEDGCLDIVALGHQMLADPEWPHKVIEGRIDEIKYCCGCNECPVSYTHLDVYKRQINGFLGGKLHIFKGAGLKPVLCPCKIDASHAASSGRLDMALEAIHQNIYGLAVFPGRAVVIVCEMRYAVWPVSYTHLDVYKRQT